MALTVDVSNPRALLLFQHPSRETGGLADGESDLVTIGRRLRICTHSSSSSGWSSLHLSEHFLSLCKVVRNSTPVAKSTASLVCCFTCSLLLLLQSDWWGRKFWFCLVLVALRMEHKTKSLPGPRSTTKQ